MSQYSFCEIGSHDATQSIERLASRPDNNDDDDADDGNGDDSSNDYELEINKI